MTKLILASLPLIALAACGGGAENKAKAKVEGMTPGQYEVAAEVTNFRNADDGKAKIDTPKGTRTTRSVCLGAGASPADLFADEGFTCRENSRGFASGGTLNLTLSCSRPGLPTGEVGLTVTGTFTADGFEAERTMETAFVTDGDVVIASRFTGRRTGDCTPAPAAPAANASQDKAK